MKKTLLSGIILGSLFSTNLMAQETDWYERFSDRKTGQSEELKFESYENEYFNKSYFSLGVERLELEVEDTGEKYKGASMVNGIYGLNMNNYISFEVSASLPLSSKVYNEYQDTYYLGKDIQVGEDGSVSYPELQVDNYKNQVDPSYILSVNLKLDMPITERFSTYLTVGYSKSKISYQGIGTLFYDNLTVEQKAIYDDPNKTLNIDSLNSNQFILGFQDSVPLSQVDDYNDYKPCEISGEESICGKEILSFDNDYEQNGTMYGLGLRFDYSNNTSLSLDYKKYAYNKALDIEAIRLGIQWNF
tara:strand:+ start:751 stop:1659 length:909 start_codon:yes stop_codon:yes gene_type:complete